MPDPGTPSLNQSLRSLREVRDDLARRLDDAIQLRDRLLRVIEADRRAAEGLTKAISDVRVHLAAVEAELRDRKAKGEDV